MKDDVNFPEHYTSGDVESIDAIWASGHGMGFCVGNAQKYLFRAGKKGDDSLEKDLRKAAWYIAFALSKISDSEDPRKSREPVLRCPNGCGALQSICFNDCIPF